MARTSNITFGQVAQIADAMKAAGNRPTARSIRERIGSGSMGTIHNLLTQYNGKTEGIEQKAAELPESIASALMEFVSTEIATACEPINEELQAAKEAADELGTENERLSNLIADLEEQSYNAEMKRAEAIGKDRASQHELAMCREENGRLRQQATELQRDYDRSQRQVEMLASYGTDLVATQSALACSEKARQESEKNAAVMAAQLEAKTENVNELCSRLKTAESRADSATTEAKNANTHYQACAARLEAAAREIEALKAVKKAPAVKVVKAKVEKVTA